MDRTESIRMTGNELVRLFQDQIGQRCGDTIAAIFTPRLHHLFNPELTYAELERAIDVALEDLRGELDAVTDDRLITCKEAFLEQVGLASLTFHAAARPEIMDDHMNLGAVIARHSPNLTVTVIETAVTGIEDIADVFGTAEPEAKAIAVFANSSLAVRLAAATFPEIPGSPH